MSAAARLLEAALDYAGTFPPAKLDLAEALRNYARYRAGPHARLLGRFLVPAAKLGEFEEIAGEAFSRSGAGAWPLSVILSADPLPEIERAAAFAGRWEGRMRVVSFEAPPLEASRLESVVA